MPDHSANTEQLELRQKLAEYEQILRLAEPRLAAFKRLEELARETRSTPEAVAAEAALQVLREEQEVLKAEVQTIGFERENLRGELAMLLDNKNDTIQVLDDLQIEHHDIHQEVAEILDELNLLRDDAVRLMTQRSELQLQVSALRNELDDIERRKIETIANLPAPSMPPAPMVGTRTPAFGLEYEDEEEESRLFDKFFHAKVEHDKARDWMLR
jgi:chromosome segregation ATPase